jgi:DHA2 family multidrug resistance protein
VLLFSTMALLPPMMQELMGYSAYESGLVSMPRGVGSFVAMFIVGRLIGRVDTRLILVVGLCLSTIALRQMSHFDLAMGQGPLIVAGLIQGFGIGLIFVPLSTVAYATLPAQFRTEGTAVFTLVRNLGASVGISVMQALWTVNSSVVHSTIVGNLEPSNPVDRPLVAPLLASADPAGLAALNAEVTRQAAMVAYIDDFRLMMLATLALAPLLLIMKTPRMTSGTLHAVAD